MIVVSGGLGMIGSALIWALNGQGERDILVIDYPGSDSRWQNLAGAGIRDIMSADKFWEINGKTGVMARASVIFHLGACSSTTERDFDLLLERNTHASMKMFELAKMYEIPFIYASSAATYGAGELGYGDGVDDITRKLRPLNAYGYSKQLFDTWVMDYAGQRPPAWFGLKFFNVYGPREEHKGPMSSVCYQGYQQIARSGRLKLFKSYHPDYADGGQLRDFIYVNDVAQVLWDFYQLALTERGREHSGIYNLGTGKARTFNDLAQQLFLSMKKNFAVDYIEMPPELKNQYQYYTEARMEKFRQLFPRFVFKSLEEGVAEYVTQYLLSKKS